MQIIIEHQDISNMEASELSNLLQQIAQKSLPAVEAQPVVSIDPLVRVKAKDIVEAPVMEAEPAKEEKPAPKKAAQKKATKVEKPEPEVDPVEKVDDEPEVKRSRAEMKKVLAEYCQAEADNVKKLKEIATEMGYSKVKDMTDEDMAVLLKMVGI